MDRSIYLLTGPHPRSCIRNNLRATWLRTKPSWHYLCCYRQRLSGIRRGWCPSHAQPDRRSLGGGVFRSDAGDAHRLSLSARVLSAADGQVKAKPWAQFALPRPDFPRQQYQARTDARSLSRPPRPGAVVKQWRALKCVLDPAWTTAVRPSRGVRFNVGALQRAPRRRQVTLKKTLFQPASAADLLEPDLHGGLTRHRRRHRHHPRHDPRMADAACDSDRPRAVGRPRWRPAIAHASRARSPGPPRSR